MAEDQGCCPRGWVKSKETYKLTVCLTPGSGVKFSMCLDLGVKGGLGTLTCSHPFRFSEDRTIGLSKYASRQNDKNTPNSHSPAWGVEGVGSHQIQAALKIRKPANKRVLKRERNSPSGKPSCLSANTQGWPAEARTRRKKENNRKPKWFPQGNHFQLQFYDR